MPNYDPDLQPIFDAILQRLAALEAADTNTAGVLDGILDLLTAMDARMDALEGGTPEEPPVEAEIEFRKPADFSTADMRENTNPTGPHTLTEPSLIERHADGTATLHAEQRLDQPGWGGRTYYSGSLVTRTPLRFARGAFGGIVHLMGRAVGALFSHGSSGKEIDFEATYLLGEAGWSPNLWMPKQGGGRHSAGVTSPRVFRRAPVTGTPQVLLARLLDDRCEFYRQTLNDDLTPAGPLTLFETITPADFPADVIWDVTTADQAICTSIEFHGTWAGWGAEDYAQPASMRVYGITPGAVEFDLAPEVTIPDTPPALDPAARTVDGIAWAFAAAGGGQAGFLDDGKTIGLARAPDGTGSNSAKATFPTQPGKLHRLHFGTRGQISVNGAGAGWAGYGPGNHVREWTPTGASETATFTNNAGALRYVGAVRLEVVEAEEPPVEPEEPEEPPVTATGSIGSNLEGVVSWSTELPLIDVLKTASLREGTDGSANYRALVELPSAMTSAAGRYRLKYRGKGTLRINGGSAITITGPGERWIDYQPTGEGGLTKSGGSLNLDTTAGDAADPLTLLSLVHESNVAAHDAGKVFSPRYLSRIAPIGTLRFMDWQRTNGSIERTWSQRMTLDRKSYAGWPGEDPGVPLELCLDLANENGSHPWLCIPHLADDDYIRQAAETVRGRLDTSLCAHVAYTNEPWNGKFPQAGWVDDQGIAQGLHTGRTRAGARFVARRLADIARIFADVFGEAERRKRYKTVLEVHPGNTWLANRQLTDEGADPEFGRRFDGYATTGYFAGNIGGGSEAQDIWNVYQAQGEAAAVNRVLQIMAGHAANMRGGEDGWDAHKANADRFGLRFMVYEGGAHADPYGSWQSNTTFLEILAKAHRAPGMAAIYRKLLDDWKAAGGTTFCIFQAIGRWTENGYWGHLEHVDDQSPRWDAVMAWAEANPAW